MSAYGGKKKNSVHPSSNHLAVQNGDNFPAVGKKKSSQRGAKSQQPIRLWTEEIQALKPCDQFFIRQTNMQTEDSIAPSNYEIRNGNGKLVFKAIESVDPAIRDLYHVHDKGKPPFVITIFDMKAGKEMLRINANLRQGVMLVYVKQSTEDKIIGIIRRVYSRCPCCPSHFSLERPNGGVLLTVRNLFSFSSLCCCTCAFIKNPGPNFNIFMSDDITNVGKISYLQKKIGIRDVEAGRNDASITAAFPGDTTATNKALVLACLFMLDSVYFEKRRRKRQPIKISKTCYIVITIVTLVALIATLAVLVGGRGFQGRGGGTGGRRPGGIG